MPKGDAARSLGFCAWALLVVREALRGMRTGRQALALAFLLLALCMSATTVTFSIVDTIALRPLPYKDPDRLVSVSVQGEAPDRAVSPSLLDYSLWVERARTFAGIGSSRNISTVPLGNESANHSVISVAVSGNLFAVLGIQPALGRVFTGGDDQPGRDGVVVISHQLWQTQFGGQPSAIGQWIVLGKRNRQIVGVLPDGVSYPISTGASPDAYVPDVATARAEPSNAPRRGAVTVVARLRDGATLVEARADLQRFSSAVVIPLHQKVVGPAGRWLLPVLAAIVMVLLVACANVANLLIARAAARAQEFATRAALGASSTNLAASVFVEGLLLAIASLAAAVVVASWSLRIATASLPPGLARASAIQLDVRVLLAVSVASFLCALLFSGIPAWLSSVRTTGCALKWGGKGITGGRRPSRILAALLVADIAFVCALLVATTVVVASFVLLTSADLGFDRRNLLSISFTHSLQEVPSARRAASAAAVRADVSRRARAVTGVLDAAMTESAAGPLGGGSNLYSINVPGIGESTKPEDMVEANAVSPEYFRVMGMQLVRGRWFTPADGAGAPGVVLLNELAVRKFFRGQEPVGRAVGFRGSRTIVGVIRDISFDGPEAAVRPIAYIPIAQSTHYGSRAFGTLIARAAADPHALARKVREAIRPAIQGEPSQPRFMDESFQRLVAARKFNAVVMSTFGLVALVIGVIGVYGATTFHVTQRVHAVGIEMALGAAPSDVMRAVLGSAMRRVILGVAIGSCIAWAASTSLKALVFGIAPTDARVYLGVAGALVTIGILAALGPAVRAARLDPLSVLRE